MEPLTTLTSTTSTASALFSSRKVWVSIITVLSVIGAVVLRATDKIPADALIPMIGSLSAAGIALIGSIAYEDAAQKGASIVTNYVSTPSPPPATPPTASSDAKDVPKAKDDVVAAPVSAVGTAA